MKTMAARPSWAVGLAAFVLLCLAPACASDGREAAPTEPPAAPARSSAGWEWDEAFATAAALHQGVFRCGDREQLAAWTCSCCGAGAVKDFRVQSVVTDTRKLLISIVGYSPFFNAAVVMFRGTCPQSLENWLSDLDISQLDADYPGVPEAKIHSGFMHAYNATRLRPGIHAALERLFAEGPAAGSPRLLVTGHSLGAAMGTLAALDLQRAFNLSADDVRVVTAGSPRVGNQAFARYYRSRVPQTTRLVNGRDLVPTLPPTRVGFYHVPSEVWIYHVDPGGGRQVIQEPIVCANAFVNNTRDDCRSTVRRRGGEGSPSRIVRRYLTRIG